MGLSMTDLMEMPWGRLVLMLQARAQSYAKEEQEEVREATWDEIMAFHGGGL
jgi:hypothetical protein